MKLSNLIFAQQSVQRDIYHVYVYKFRRGVAVEAYISMELVNGKDIFGFVSFQRTVDQLSRNYYEISFLN